MSWNLHFNNYIVCNKVHSHNIQSEFVYASPKNIGPDFVDKYLDKTGRGPDVIAGCNSAYYMPFSPEYCHYKMAKYHIDNDLQGTLNSLGCGTDGDWDKVAKIITQCVTQSTQYDPLRRWVADSNVQSWRNVTRQSCKAARNER